MSPALGLGGPQSLALWTHAPWEGRLWGQPRVIVSPQEAGRPDPLAVGCVEGRAELWAMVSRSVVPSILSRGDFEGRRVSEGPARSPAQNDPRRP